MPPAKIPVGNYELRAYAKRGDARYEMSIEPLASLPADEVVAAVAPSVDRYLTWRGPA